MKTPKSLFLKIATLAIITAFATSCTTTYDAYGQPRQTVDPGLAVAGAAAAGLIGYAIANNKDDDRRYRKGHSNYKRHSRSDRYYSGRSHHNSHRNYGYRY